MPGLFCHMEREMAKSLGEAILSLRMMSWSNKRLAAFYASFVFMLLGQFCLFVVTPILAIVFLMGKMALETVAIFGISAWIVRLLSSKAYILVIKYGYDD